MVRRLFKDSAPYDLATFLSKGTTALKKPVYKALISKAETRLPELLPGVMAVLMLTWSQGRTRVAPRGRHRGR